MRMVIYYYCVILICVFVAENALMYFAVRGLQIIHQSTVLIGCLCVKKMLNKTCFPILCCQLSPACISGIRYTLYYCCKL